ncbi:potassium transporter Kup [Pseudoxanthomonas sacheonensis]|uniref:potassium transporter Kup n=1 Tax=Pseudoxanthomonas sacheonensis TaxID=443615 RepID=UPI0013D2A047|nr:potassium transporter Kup [Pseudoxanthomonas sacheonensis]KAF1708635.1 potassium transporter Kup [Pseudoxanthomonas sacheonensis]
MAESNGTDAAVRIDATHAAAPLQALPALAMAALGIVFGDIATSPLYALQEAFGAHGVRPTEANVLGVLSLTFWSLVGVVSLKYVLFIMRAHNKGEGGIMALLALAQRALREQPRLRWWAVMAGLAGASLFFGDSVITPAISVLSAVEGLKVAAPGLEAWIVPVSVLILVGLFAMQRFGTARVGKWFGPVMLVWLLVIGLLGLASLLKRPEVLAALSPHHALEFFLRNGFAGFTTLGATVLVLTGAEALYADMGHFGARPIRFAWTTVALPCLLLSYFGQGALLLGDPLAAAGPFYRMVPGWALYPMIGLAALATIIASQAVISGAYSMIREGIQLGYLPRMRVLQTSSQVRGQIYLPAINTILMVLVLAATLGFRSSSALAASFGIAVSGTMLMTTILALVVARRTWHWPLAAVIPLAVLLLVVDLAFVGANLMKLGSGGWFPLALGTVVFTVMVTWRRGRELLAAQIRSQGVPLEPYIASLREYPPTRVPGTALFLTTDPTSVPQALMHNLKHNKVLHARNVIVTVEMLDEPDAPPGQRVGVEDLGGEFYRIQARFGFAESPDVLTALDACAVRGLGFELMETTFFTSRENIIAGDRTGMARWRDLLFAYLARNAMPATAFFRIPDNRLIEIGRRVVI